jgi:hypothetical protein
MEARTYDQLRGVPLSITEAQGTPQERTTTYVWDTRFLKPTTVISPVQTPNGVGSQTATYTYDNQGNMTAWSLAVTGPGNYAITRGGSATYNIVSHPTRRARARRVLGFFVEIIRPCRPLDASLAEVVLGSADCSVNPIHCPKPRRPTTGDSPAKGT